MKAPVKLSMEAQSSSWRILVAEDNEVNPSDQGFSGSLELPPISPVTDGRRSPSLINNVTISFLWTANAYLRRLSGHGKNGASKDSFVVASGHVMESDRRIAFRQEWTTFWKNPCV